MGLLHIPTFDSFVFTKHGEVYSRPMDPRVTKFPFFSPAPGTRIQPNAGRFLVCHRVASIIEPFGAVGPVHM